MKITRPKIESDVNYAHADVSSFDFEKTIGDKKQDLILLETSATCNLVGGPDFHRTIGPELPSANLVNWRGARAIP
jgi:hypothetical protein